MQVLEWNRDVFPLLCKSMKKWGMLISFSVDVDQDAGSDVDILLNEVPQAAPYFSPDTVGDNYFQIILDGSCVLLFDDEKEMTLRYDQTVGDDGPTKLNKYDGPARVYAITCSPEGELLGENT
jgi:hypothetical protein